jgi:hypothetical protein
MIIDIWYCVLFFISNDKDVFNIASVNRDFYQLTEKRLMNFPWYKFHKKTQSSYLIPHNDQDILIESFISPSFGAKFQIVQRKELHYLLIIDYTGTKWETCLRKGDRNDHYFLHERLGYFQIEIIILSDQTFKFEINLDNEEFPDDDYPPRYQYCLRNSASLISSGINADVHRLVDCGTLEFQRNDITIVGKYHRRLHHSKPKIIKLYLKHAKTTSLSQCTYHSLPLQNHRFFVCESQNQIYVIFVRILDTENYEITCDIIYQGSHNDDLSQYVLNYSEKAKMLSIIKHKNHLLKIIKEIPFDDFDCNK